MSAPSKKTAKEISDLFISTLEAQLSQTVPLLPKSFNRVIAKLMGLVFVVLFQWSEFVALQLFVGTASDKPITIGGITLTPLDMWGTLIGLTRNTGLRSEGTATIPVLSSGGTLLAGSTALDPNTGELYLTIGDVAITGSSITVSLRAVNYSAAATMYTGQVLSLVSAPVNLSKTVTVSTVTQQGADAEDTETWRARQLAWWAARPQGGAYADYREWGGEVDGVENIYPFSGGTPAIATSGPGQVDIYVEASGTTDGIAGAALLAAVYDNIEQTAATGLADRRPTNCYVNVASIYRKTFNPIISGLSAPDTVETMAAIEDAVTEYMLSRENYILGLSRLPRKDTISNTELGGVVGRVAAAYGGLITGVSIGEYIGSVEQPTYTLSEGEKAKLGTITWT